jgi:hypothetical protein
MKTDDLIRALAADHAPPRGSPRRMLGVATVLGLVVAAALFAVVLGARPDFTTAMGEPRFVFKFLVTLVLAATAFLLGRRLLGPLDAGMPWWLALATAPLLLALAVAIELAVLPSGSWKARLVGSNALLCLASVPLLALPIMIAVLTALRQGAPVRPGLTGAVAGLLAGGLGAALYAAHCIDDSPLFVAAWYSTAIALVSIGGAVAGRRYLRW